MISYIDILLALLQAMAFPLGFLLYAWSKDEVDAVVKRFPFLNWTKKFTLLLSGATGVIAAWATVEILLLMFAVNLAASSIGFRNWRESVRPALGFAVLFLGIKYILLSA